MAKNGVIMMRATALTFALVAVAGAFAQTTGSNYAKVGILLPLDKDVRDGIGKNGLDLRFGYGLQQPLIMAPNSKGFVELGGSFLSGNGNRLNVYNLQYVQKFYSEGPSKGFYYGAGLGLNYTDQRVTFVVVPGSGGSAFLSRENSKRLNISGQLLVGYNITEQAFAEVSLNLAPKVNSVQQTNVVISVGLKF